MKKLSALILSLALSAALLAGCGASASTAASSEAVSSEVVSEAVSEEAVSTAEAADSAEAIQFTFTVTGADGESTVLTLDAADGEKLSTALADAGVISAEEAEAGFVTVVNGEAADYNKDGSWWCLTDAAGEMTSVGAADIELHDGDSYAFTYNGATTTRIVGLARFPGLMGALLVVSEQAMSGLPNIEPVTLLIILFALELPRETPARHHGIHPFAGCALRLWAVVGDVPVHLVFTGHCWRGLFRRMGSRAVLGRVQRAVRTALRRVNAPRYISLPRRPPLR